MKTILVQKASKKGIKFIDMRVSENEVIREWGLIGGKPQTNIKRCTGKNIGKKNEKTPEQVALAEFTKIKNKKIREGYVETSTLEDLPNLDDPEINLDNLPLSFAVSKPTQKISMEYLNELILSGHGRIFTKYDGLCHFIVIGSTGKVQILTRRLYDHTTKYPEIVKYVEKRQFPPNSMFMVELCVDPNLRLPHVEAFKLMQSISKVDCHNGLPDNDITETLERQKKHEVRAVVLAVLYWKGKESWKYSMHNHFIHIQNLFLESAEGYKLFKADEAKVFSAAALKQLLKDNEIWLEGFVIWDERLNMEVTLNGKPKRVASWKVKLPKEMDVVAYDCTIGDSGRLMDKVAALLIGLPDKNGKIQPLGKVASGIKSENGMADRSNWTFPCVIEIEYDQIFLDTGKFEFASITKKHEDKTIKEVNFYEDHMKNK